MKKLISFLASIGLAGSVFATGSFPINSPQSGVSAFTGTTQTNVITFSPAFTTTPIVQVFGSVTNASPITTTVTSSNLTIVVSSTNLSVAWNAYLGYPRVQFGTNAITGGTPLTNTFTTPYAFAPVLSVEGSTTNGIGITSVTPTNFILTSAATQNLSWAAIGQAYAPGAQNVTY